MSPAPLVFGLFYLAAFTMLGAAAWWGRRSHLAASWPTSRGTIRQISIRKSASKSGQRVRLDVEYTYSVRDVAYAGKRIAFGLNQGVFEDRLLIQVYRRLKRASSIEVRYNPAKPSDCCLTYGWHKVLQCQVGFVLLMLMFLTGMAISFAASTGPDTVLLENLSVH